MLDAEAALADGSPLVHEKVYPGGEFRGFDDQSAARPSNICQAVHLEWGDAEAAMATASGFVEGEYYFPMAYAYAMEPYVAVANFNAGSLTVYSSAQHPFMVRHDLAMMFELPLSRVRVIVPFVGGGYGSKSYTKIEPLAAVCSWKSGCPVKLQLSVQEAFLTTRGDDALVRVKTAVDDRGKLLARIATIYLNTGAYAENSPLVCKKAANRIIGAYRIPNVKVDAYAIYTNTVPASSYRGFGAAQVTFPAESQMGELAEKLGRDPIEFRSANLANRGEEIHPGYRPLDADVSGDLQLVARSLRAGKAAKPGMGLAAGCSASDAGALPVTTAYDGVIWDTAIGVLLSLQRATGVRLHILHLQTGRSADMIRSAKAEGRPVSAEVNPWALWLGNDWQNIERLGSYALSYYVPPNNAEATWKAVLDGTVDVIATDHAPHLKEEKEPGWTDGWKAHTGTPSAQHYLSLLLTDVSNGKISMERAIELVSLRPAKLFGLYPRKGAIRMGSDADIVAVDMNTEKTITNEEVLSKCGWTPYAGKKVRGVPVHTVVRGQFVFEDGEVVGKPGYGRLMSPVTGRS